MAVCCLPPLVHAEFVPSVLRSAPYPTHPSPQGFHAPIHSHPRPRPLPHPPAATCWDLPSLGSRAGGPHFLGRQPVLGVFLKSVGKAQPHSGLLPIPSTHVRSESWPITLNGISSLPPPFHRWKWRHREVSQLAWQHTHNSRGRGSIEA